MIEADSKAIWNLPFLCPYLNQQIFHLPYYSGFSSIHRDISSINLAGVIINM